MPAQGDPAEVLAPVFSPPHFPVTPGQLGSGWRVTAFEAGDHAVEGFHVVTAEIPHKGGRAFGYRVSNGGGTLAYLSDHSPIATGDGQDGLGAYHDGAMALAGDVDVLVHDAPHTAAEFRSRRHLGHSAVEYAVGLAHAAGARKLVLFHHDPSRTDDEIDALVAAQRGGAVDVVAASEGLVLDL